MQRTRPWRALVILAATGRLSAGETVVVDGYAQQMVDGPVLISLSPLQGTVLSVPAAPGDRSFIPPALVRWEVQITGVDDSGTRTGVALRSAPDGFAWPAGEEVVPGRYHGSIGGMFPSANTLDPLNVAAGSGIPDYDQDGIADGEDAFPGDPQESLDSDGDGIGDNADTDDDDDGIPDAWELAHGTDPLVDDATADHDHDGFPARAEYEAGTDPRNPASFFRVDRVEPAPGTFRITFDAVPDRTYTLFHKPGLSARPVIIRSGITSATPQPLAITVPRLSPVDFYYLQVSITPPP